MLEMVPHTPWYFNIAMENGPFLVEIPIKNGDFPVRYVNLPEGIYTRNPGNT